MTQNENEPPGSGPLNNNPPENIQEPEDKQLRLDDVLIDEASPQREMLDESLSLGEWMELLGPGQYRSRGLS